MGKKINVLVVDDSALMRKLISNLISKDPDINVADTAINGLFALKKLKKSNVDIILLDIEMPGMNGFEFLKMRKDLGIDIPVVMLSSLGATKPKVTFEALDLGAKDFIIKPSGSISSDIHVVGHEIIAAIKRYGGERHRTPVDVEKIDLELEKIFNKAKEKQSQTKKIDFNQYTSIVRDRHLENRLKDIKMILIGISTGGPAALRQMIPRLKKINYPILIVQHMPAGFTSEFAKGLGRLSLMDVKEAENGDVLQKGCVYIAPGDKHMSFHEMGGEFKVDLIETAPINGHRPSVEVMYNSAVKYKVPVLAIIMTGMGKDGALGLKELYNLKNVTIAQSPKDCVVFGMPKSAIELGVVDKVLEIKDIADFINNIE